MTRDELLRRIRVGSRAPVALVEAVPGLDGWYLFLELLSESEAEIRFQASANEEGGPSFFGTFESFDSMFEALAARFGEPESWAMSDPEWEPRISASMVEALRQRIREKALPLPHGFEQASDDEFWSP